MELLKDYKIHILCFVIVIACEAIGTYKFGYIVLLPMLYAMLVGASLSEAKMKRASGIMGAALMLLIVKLSLSIGPALAHLQGATGALILQEIGHFLGTIMLGLPIAVALGMGREAVGATYSVGREPNIAIIADRYTLDSPEGRGVMATYLMGTLFGALTVSVLASVIGSMDILHPYALAMGAGVGSGSMMAAATGSIISLYPDMKEQITAYAGAANLMSSILGIYVYMFFSLPFASKMYVVFSRLFGKKIDTEESAKVGENA